MKVIFSYPLLLIAILAMASCSPDPRNAADAARTLALTSQDVLDRTQGREQTEAKQALQLQEAQALAAERAAAGRRLIRWAGLAGSVAIAGAILAAGVGMSWAAVGTGRAVARLAIVRANLIPLAENTRQFPLILQYIGKGRYSLANPNAGSVAELDTRRAEDRQLISVSGAVMLAGVVAREARRSMDPAGVAIIQPAIVRGGNDE